MADLATIARPYAEALFRSAKPAELSAIAEQLEELAQVASNPDLLAVANNPKLADADLLQILLGGMKTKPADIVKNFVEVLTHNNRLLAMPEIAAQFTALRLRLSSRVNRNWHTFAMPFHHHKLQWDFACIADTVRIPGRCI